MLVVSFGELKGAQQWLAETECPFPMLLDPQRKVEVFLRILTSQTMNLVMVNAVAHFSFFFNHYQIFEV